MLVTLMVGECWWRGCQMTDCGRGGWKKRDGCTRAERRRKGPCSTWEQKRKKERVLCDIRVEMVKWMEGWKSKSEKEESGQRAPMTAISVALPRQYISRTFDMALRNGSLRTWHLPFPPLPPSLLFSVCSHTARGGEQPFCCLNYDKQERERRFCLLLWLWLWSLFALLLVHHRACRYLA